MRNFLNFKQDFEVAKLLTEQYTASGLTDREFADMATKTLGFPVAQKQIEHRRNELGIPASIKACASRVGYTDLLRRVEVLEKRVDVYLSGR